MSKQQDIGINEDKTTSEPDTIKPAYKLKDLLAECDLDAAAPEDQDAWNNDGPAGKESL